ncbi:MAG: NHL repeat-containing protein, partial [Chloroflexota bacterium]|nr:NHL repeat-containing protein [Chloroflexota bacterium]
LNDVKVFDNQGNYVTKWTMNPTGPQKFAGPSGIAHGPDDSVYLVEQYAHKISKFTEDGQLLFSWGSEGAGNGEFNLPWGISTDVEGHVYVADWGNDRIQKFTADGEFMATYGESGYQEGQFNKPSSVAVDSKGFIHVADWGNERVQVLNPRGEFHQLLEGEATLSKWAEEWLEVNLDEYDLRKESNLLVKELPKHLQTPYHKASQSEPIFWGPVSVKIDTEDRLYVTEHSRHRIQIYEQ